MRRLLVLSLTGLCGVALLAPVADAKEFSNCAAMHKVYEGGVAKRKAAQKRAIADGVKIAPIVNAKVYAENASRDRDKDGVACER